MPSDVSVALEKMLDGYDFAYTVANTWAGQVTELYILVHVKSPGGLQSPNPLSESFDGTLVHDTQQTWSLRCCHSAHGMDAPCWAARFTSPQEDTLVFGDKVLPRRFLLAVKAAGNSQQET